MLRNVEAYSFYCKEWDFFPLIEVGGNHFLSHDAQRNKDNNLKKKGTGGGFFKKRALKVHGRFSWIPARHPMAERNVSRTEALCSQNQSLTMCVVLLRP